MRVHYQLWRCLNEVMIDRIVHVPAESDSPNLPSPWDRSNSLDKWIDERLADSFSVLDQPRWQCRTNSRSVLSLVNQGELFTSLKRGLHRLQELNWKRVALVNIWNIAVKFGLCIVVRKKANVFEFPSENYRWLSQVQGTSIEFKTRCLQWKQLISPWSHLLEQRYRSVNCWLSRSFLLERLHGPCLKGSIRSFLHRSTSRTFNWKIEKLNNCI